VRNPGYTLLPIVRGDRTGEPSSWEVSWPTEASFRLEQQDISRRVSRAFEDFRVTLSEIVVAVQPVREQSAWWRELGQAVHEVELLYGMLSRHYQGDIGPNPSSDPDPQPEGSLLAKPITVDVLDPLDAPELLSLVGHLDGDIDATFVLRHRHSTPPDKVGCGGGVAGAPSPQNRTSV